MGNLYFLIIDEFFIISSNMINTIKSHCKEAKPVFQRTLVTYSPLVIFERVLKEKLKVTRYLKLLIVKAFFNKNFELFEIIYFFLSFMGNYNLTQTIQLDRNTSIFYLYLQSVLCEQQHIPFFYFKSLRHQERIYAFSEGAYNPSFKYKYFLIIIFSLLNHSISVIINAKIIIRKKQYSETKFLYQGAGLDECKKINISKNLR